VVLVAHKLTEQGDQPEELSVLEWLGSLWAQKRLQWALTERDSARLAAQEARDALAQAGP
jgi:hypothetical protein